MMRLIRFSILAIFSLSILYLLAFLLVHIDNLFSSAFVFDHPSSLSPSCLSPPTTQDQNPPSPFPDSTLILPGWSLPQVPRPTYAPRSGSSITSCQGNVTEMKASAYLDFGLACLMNQTFKHESICISALCDGIMIYLPDSPSIVRKYAKKLATMEATRKEEEEARQQQQEKGEVEVTSSLTIPMMPTRLWLDCAHRYLPRSLLTEMAREHHRHRSHRCILWLLLVAIASLAGGGMVYLHICCREPVEFVDEKIKAGRIHFQLRRRICVPIPEPLAQWLGIEGRVQLRRLDWLTWVQRMDVKDQVWFKDFERPILQRRKERKEREEQQE